MIKIIWLEGLDLSQISNKIRIAPTENCLLRVLCKYNIVIGGEQGLSSNRRPREVQGRRAPILTHCLIHYNRRKSLVCTSGLIDIYGDVNRSLALIVHANQRD